MTPFSLLAPTYLQMLGALSNWLDKAEGELPEAQVAALASARLAPDMFPLSTQVRFACAQALEGVHRLQGVALPPLHAILLEEGREAGDKPGSLSEARTRIAETITLVSARPESAGSDGAAMIAHELPNGMVFDLTADQYGRDWALGQFRPAGGSNLRRSATGALLGVALARTLYVHVQRPLPPALVAQLALALLVAMPVLVFASWRAR